MTTQTLPDLGADPVPERPHRPRRRRWVLVGLVVLLLVGGLAARAWWPHQKADVRAGTTLVSAEGMAARTGINVSLIAVTAAGGLIEFRYQVVDPDKAERMLHDPAQLPVLVVEDTGATLAIRSTPHRHARNLELGGTYFFLIANAHNAVRPGSPVTLVMGDARLEHLVAQG